MISSAAERLRERLPTVLVEEGGVVSRFQAAGIVPQCVVRPSSISEVSSIVHAAQEADVALVPVGNATHLDIGWPPRRYDAALSTQALDRIVAHDVGDMTITAEAGVTLAALERVLAGHGQWLPLDPPSANEMTIGGLIAADRNGPLRLAHGKVRDFLIGLTVVIGGGKLVKGGGRVVKNVAGYDLPKLFTGSFGTLGVIVEATFKVRPRPPEQDLFVWPATSLDEALARAILVLDSLVCPILLEAVNEASAEALGLSPTAALLIGCAGTAVEIAEQGARLATVSTGGASRYDQSRADAVLEALRNFPESSTDDTMVVRISTIPTGLAPLLSRIEVAAVARRVVVEIAAHAGSGVAWCQLAAPGDVPALSLFAEWLRVCTHEHHGWAIFETVPAPMRSRIDPWGFHGATLPLMAQVKKTLDPESVFSPGRFVGSI